MAIIFVVGDATLPQSANNTIIAHSCNDLGVFGAGFVVPLGNRYPTVREKYLQWAQDRKTEDNKPFELGEVQFVKVENTLWVANIIGQKGVGFKRGPAVQYEAIYDGFNKVAKFAKNALAEVVMPRIGCGLGGGDWVIVEKLIEQTFVKNGVKVTVCDLPSKEDVSPNVGPIFGW